ncbi:MAG: DUF5610 domain-containing protein [Gammaproteobacteria bacterium]|nr:DUF5610 domain-containing protein [Gammaproteobacteria bacterium]
MARSPVSSWVATGLDDSTQGFQRANPLDRIQQIVNHRVSQHLGSPERSAPFNAQNTAFDAEEVAGNVLGMVQSRLNQATAEGADDQQLQAMREQAKQGIEQGIAESKEYLSGMGMLNEMVEEGIDRVRDLLSQGLQSDDDMTSQEVVGTKVIDASHYFKQTAETSFELEIETRDGDQVTLKFEQVNSEEGFLSYQQTADSEAFSTGHTVLSDSRFELSVEGELDEQELAAITDFTQNLEQVSNSFYDGNVQAALEQGMQLGYDTDEIAGFALELEYSQSSVATTRYREVSSLGQEEQSKLPGLEQLGALLGQLRNAFTQAEDQMAQVEQAGAGLLTNFISHHPKATDFSELLQQHGDEELEDVVGQLVGHVSDDHEAEHDD